MIIGTASQAERRRRHWRANRRLVGALLAIWFAVGCVLSFVLVEPLNEIRIAGFPFGFWMAQQGSILVFIGLIGIYAFAMNRVDRSLREGRPEERE